MVNVRSGPNWASIGFAQDAQVGVRHNSTLLRAAQARTNPHACRFAFPHPFLEAHCHDPGA